MHSKICLDWEDCEYTQRMQCDTIHRASNCIVELILFILCRTESYRMQEIWKNYHRSMDAHRWKFYEWIVPAYSTYREICVWIQHIWRVCECFRIHILHTISHKSIAIHRLRDVTTWKLVEIKSFLRLCRELKSNKLRSIPDLSYCRELRIL